MTAPIFSLPDELLLCVVSAADAEQFEWSGRQAPFYWTISHVCRRFRDAVVGAPTLWSKIEIELTNPASWKISDLYMERSEACALSVTLRHSRDTRPHNELLSLLSHSNRIQRLTIIPKGWTEQILSPFRHAPAASLECLQIEVESRFEYNGPLDMFLSGAPRLRALKLSHCQLPDVVPPWMASIVDLDLAVSKFSPRMAASFPSLRHLTIDGYSCSEPVQLPTLTSLCLYLENGEGDVAEAFNHFTTPALSALTVQNAHGDHVPALFNSTHLVSSHSALTSITLVGEQCECENHDGYFPEVISFPPARAFPAVTSLSLIDVCYAATIVRNIFSPDFALWPLRTLTIGTRAGVDDLYGALTDVVRAAQQQNRDIPKFRLSLALFYLPYWQENNVDVELFEGLEATH
ncbi:hypothetical protein C8J57DRAFT_211389 [Mycena rebaudengoi]|nr:hypothetical protein C8J57DRAFT_211389 [Mycena rebaudengoi]